MIKEQNLASKTSAEQPVKNDAKPTMSNKERARKARQRKKKYYEDLENKVTNLQKENDSLKSQLDYWKSKIQFLERVNYQSTSSDTGQFQMGLIDDCIDIVASLPKDREGLLKIISQMNDSFGPYGHNHVKILDSCFQSIVENSCGSVCKLMLYCCDKNLPKSKEEFDSYKVMK